MPFHAAGLRIDRHDRRKKQIVAAVRAANPARQRPTVAETEIGETKHWIVAKRIPGIAAASDVPARVLRPGPARECYFRRFVRTMPRIAGNRPESPAETTRFRIVRTHVSARPHIGAGISDQDIVACDMGSAVYDGVESAIDD